MDEFTILLAGILLRIGIPVLCMGGLIYLMSRLDARWQHEAMKQGQAAIKLSTARPCWEQNGCSPEQRAACPAAKSTEPCWQVFRQSNGHLAQKCLDCLVFRVAPVPLALGSASQEERNMTRFERFSIVLTTALILAGVTLLMTQLQTSLAAPASHTTVVQALSTPTAQAAPLALLITAVSPPQAQATPTTQRALVSLIDETSSQNVVIPTGQPNTCAACHKDTYDSWQKGAHGQARISGVFQKAWQAQGQPGACLVCHTTGYDPATGKWKEDGVACESCHNPAPVNHPTDKMPINTSPELCGKCHSDPKFGSSNWQTSAHSQRGMGCSVCHDAHLAGMKSVNGVGGGQADASALCVNCHKDSMKNFPTSNHAQAGVTCVNCHLGFNTKDKTFESAHKAPDHSFLPSLSTCGKCHADQMHAPGQAVAAAAIKTEHLGGTPTPGFIPVATAIPSTSSEPTPVSPVGFAGIAGLLGLAGGMVLAPWLERTYRKAMQARPK